MNNILIAVGGVLLLVGLIGKLLAYFGITKMPGDIVIQKGNATFMFPIVTCLLISIIGSIILQLLSRK